MSCSFEVVFLIVHSISTEQGIGFQRVQPLFWQELAAYGHGRALVCVWTFDDAENCFQSTGWTSF